MSLSPHLISLDGILGLRSVILDSSEGFWDLLDTCGANGVACILALIDLGAAQCSSATASMNWLLRGRSSIILAEVYFNLRKPFTFLMGRFEENSRCGFACLDFTTTMVRKAREPSCTGPRPITKRLYTTNHTRSKYSVAFSTRTHLCFIFRLDIQSFNQALFMCLDLERQEFRVNTAQRQAATHEPQLWVSGRSPHLHK